MLGESVVVGVPAVDQPAVAELDDHTDHLEVRERWRDYDDGGENLLQWRLRLVLLLLELLLCSLLVERLVQVDDDKHECDCGNNARSDERESQLDLAQESTDRWTENVGGSKECFQTRQVLWPLVGRGTVRNVTTE